MSQSPTSLPEELNFVRLFDAYWTEVSGLKRRVDGSRKADDTMSPDSVRHRVIRLLEEKSSEFGRHTESFEYQQFRSVLYIMAALADETFLSFDWAGRDDWSENLIEASLFDSHDAGVRFFDILDQLLDQRDSAQRPVAVVYLLALSLGFKGRFYGTDRCEESLGEYRSRLYNFIYGARPARRLEGVPLCPQTGYFNATSEAERFPSVARWFFLGTLAVLLVIALSHAAWLYGTGEIDGALQQFGALQ